ncbi:putative ABC transporter solute-binding protein YclQ precursor [Clostridium tepidiprofundi DSM 19306]|uniref:Putative ABC transporter solute-binding protein YclQ n=1 Tax=Clostridium tepidiprofundi DSM 19306 TaxID=1121338 RepID=A0A151B701_9CLOT|nr:ABC transporter substrate-binding protein [Clostridium tepidiprofundi]KYH35522.1 putative ABC transporter solute-binding protein YclQ precursor [Clostridium tepidiprofundi DSM 19306]
MKKKLAFSIVLMVTMIFLLSACGNGGTSDTGKSNNTKEVSVKDNVNKNINNDNVKVIKFVDDMGKEVVMKQPAKRIISLYSAHTENLFALGLDKEIIGVSKSDRFPEAVKTKKAYSFKDDPETIIAAKPDLVLIRTMIAKGYPDFVKALENAGINVVTLYVTDFNDFDDYINKLGMLTGKEKEAKEKLKEFHKTIDEIKAKAEKITKKKKVYFESRKKNYQTATPNSFAGTALKLVGAENIASDLEVSKKSSTVVSYGEEKLLSKANDIDVFVAQKGVMNKTVSIDEIKSRPGFDKIKAVKNGDIYIIDEKLISASNFRFAEGLKLLQKMIYPELYK